MSLLRPAIWLTPLNRVEFAHAAFLHVFRKRATVIEAENAIKNFEEDCALGVWRLVARSIELAREFGPTLGVRILDSLHVACALGLKAERFWTFDARQARLAEAVGLDTGS